MNQKPAEDNKDVPKKPLNSAWSTFLACIVVHMTIPLIPLGLERYIENTLSEKSIVITAAMYAIALGISSRWMWFVFTAFALSLIYSSLFGYISRESILAANLQHAIDSKGLWTISFLWATHSLERFNRHIQLREPFFEFKNR